MEGIWLAIGFICTSIFSATALPSFPVPLAYTPLLLIVGVMVLHRIGIVQGMIWLVLSGTLLLYGDGMPMRTLAYIASAVIGAFFAGRTFAKRSVYALLGLGLIVGLVFIATLWFVNATTLFFGQQSIVQLSGYEARWTIFLLEAGLYVGFLLSVSLRTWFERVFYVSSTTT